MKKKPLTKKDEGVKHVKPTKEELDDKADEALKKAEKIKEEPEKPKEPEETTETKEPPQPDYKKKFVDSSREAQILHAKNKKTNEVLQKAMEVSEPTQEELEKEYPNWEEMTTLEQRMAKDNLINNRRFQVLEEITKENKDLEKWQGEVDKFVKDPKTLNKTPELEGREDEFILFATKPTRRNVEFEVLVSAFLHDATKTTSKKKGAMFETGTGGPSTKSKPKSDKITLEQARKLRTTDYNKYKEYLKSGKIDTTIA